MFNMKLHKIRSKIRDIEINIFSSLRRKSNVKCSFFFLNIPIILILSYYFEPVSEI